MRLATVLTPPTPENLQLSVQCGVTDFVTRYPGPTLKDVRRVHDDIEKSGLRLSVIEGYLPIERIKRGVDDGRDMLAMKNLIRHMGEVQIPVLCYNFMAGTDWVRTKLDAPERGGARVTAFDIAEVDRAMDLAATTTESVDHEQERVTETQLWESLEGMLDELLPVAEEAGVVLAMHPDDPPLSDFRGLARIMNSIDGFDRLLQLASSPSNGICFCQGTFAEMNADIVAAIERFGSAIKYVHFRDVRGTATQFCETFHDNGPTDMVAAMNAYQRVGFDGPIRPDHVPQLVGEYDGEPGYTMLGRLFAFGYMRGLIQAATS
jgi:mannonate dehydratase